MFRKSKEGRLVNDFVEIVKRDLNEVRKELLLEGKTLTDELVKYHYKGLPDSDEIINPIFLVLYDEYNQKFIVTSPK